MQETLTMNEVCDDEQVAVAAWENELRRIRKVNFWRRFWWWCRWIASKWYAIVWIVCMVAAFTNGAVDSTVVSQQVKTSEIEQHLGNTSTNQKVHPPTLQVKRSYDKQESEDLPPPPTHPPLLFLSSKQQHQEQLQQQQLQRQLQWQQELQQRQLPLTRLQLQLQHRQRQQQELQPSPLPLPFPKQQQQEQVQQQQLQRQLQRWQELQQRQLPLLRLQLQQQQRQRQQQQPRQRQTFQSSPHLVPPQGMPKQADPFQRFLSRVVQQCLVEDEDTFSSTFGVASVDSAHTNKEVQSPRRKIKPSFSKQDTHASQKGKKSIATLETRQVATKSTSAVRSTFLTPQQQQQQQTPRQPMSQQLLLQEESFRQRVQNDFDTVVRGRCPNDALNVKNDICQVHASPSTSPNTVASTVSSPSITPSPSASPATSSWISPVVMTSAAEDQPVPLGVVFVSPTLPPPPPPTPADAATVADQVEESIPEKKMEKHSLGDSETTAAASVDLLAVVSKMASTGHARSTTPLVGESAMKPKSASVPVDTSTHTAWYVRPNLATMLLLSFVIVASVCLGLQKKFAPTHDSESETCTNGHEDKGEEGEDSLASGSTQQLASPVTDTELDEDFKDAQQYVVQSDDDDESATNATEATQFSVQGGPDETSVNETEVDGTASAVCSAGTTEASLAGTLKARHAKTAGGRTSTTDQLAPRSSTFPAKHGAHCVDALCAADVVGPSGMTCRGTAAFAVVDSSGEVDRGGRACTGGAGMDLQQQQQKRKKEENQGRFPLSPIENVSAAVERASSMSKPSVSVVDRPSEDRATASATSQVTAPETAPAPAAVPVAANEKVGTKPRRNYRKLANDSAAERAKRAAAKARRAAARASVPPSQPATCVPDVSSLTFVEQQPGPLSAFRLEVGDDDDDKNNTVTVDPNNDNNDDDNNNVSNANNDNAVDTTLTESSYVLDGAGHHGNFDTSRWSTPATGFGFGSSAAALTPSASSMTKLSVSVVDGPSEDQAITAAIDRPNTSTENPNARLNVAALNAITSRAVNLDNADEDVVQGKKDQDEEQLMECESTPFKKCPDSPGHVPQPLPSHPAGAANNNNGTASSLSLDMNLITVPSFPSFHQNDAGSLLSLDEYRILTQHSVALDCNFTRAPVPPSQPATRVPDVSSLTFVEQQPTGPSAARLEIEGDDDDDKNNTVTVDPNNDNDDNNNVNNNDNPVDTTLTESSYALDGAGRHGDFDTSCWGGAFSEQSQKWKCSRCNSYNEQSLQKCPACEKPRGEAADPLRPGAPGANAAHTTMGQQAASSTTTTTNSTVAAPVVNGQGRFVLAAAAPAAAAPTTSTTTSIGSTFGTQQQQPLGHCASAAFQFGMSSATAAVPARVDSEDGHSKKKERRGRDDNDDNDAMASSAGGTGAIATPFGHPRLENEDVSLTSNGGPNVGFASTPVPLSSASGSSNNNATGSSTAVAASTIFSGENGNKATPFQHAFSFGASLQTAASSTSSPPHIAKPSSNDNTAATSAPFIGPTFTFGSNKAPQLTILAGMTMTAAAAPQPLSLNSNQSATFSTLAFGQTPASSGGTGMMFGSSATTSASSSHQAPSGPTTFAFESTQPAAADMGKPKPVTSARLTLDDELVGGPSFPVSTHPEKESSSDMVLNVSNVRKEKEKSASTKLSDSSLGPATPPQAPPTSAENDQLSTVDSEDQDKEQVREYESTSVKNPQPSLSTPVKHTATLGDNEVNVDDVEEQDDDIDKDGDDDDDDELDVDKQKFIMDIPKFGMGKSKPATSALPTLDDELVGVPAFPVSTQREKESSSDMVLNVSNVRKEKEKSATTKLSASVAEHTGTKLPPEHKDMSPEMALDHYAFLTKSGTKKHIVVPVSTNNLGATVKQVGKVLILWSSSQTCKVDALNKALGSRRAVALLDYTSYDDFAKNFTKCKEENREFSFNVLAEEVSTKQEGNGTQQEKQQQPRHDQQQQAYQEQQLQHQQNLQLVGAASEDEDAFFGAGFDDFDEEDASIDEERAGLPAAAVIKTNKAVAEEAVPPVSSPPRMTTRAPAGRSADTTTEPPLPPPRMTTRARASHLAETIMDTNKAVVEEEDVSPAPPSRTTTRAPRPATVSTAYPDAPMTKLPSGCKARASSTKESAEPEATKPPPKNNPSPHLLPGFPRVPDPNRLKEEPPSVDPPLTKITQVENKKLSGVVLPDQLHVLNDYFHFVSHCRKGQTHIRFVDKRGRYCKIPLEKLKVGITEGRCTCCKGDFAVQVFCGTKYASGIKQRNNCCWQEVESVQKNPNSAVVFDKNPAAGYVKKPTRNSKPLCYFLQPEVDGDNDMDDDDDDDVEEDDDDEDNEEDVEEDDADEDADAEKEKGDDDEDSDD